VLICAMIDIDTTVCAEDLIRSSRIKRWCIFITADLESNENDVFFFSFSPRVKM
jgi:hypothetical protein